MIGLSASLCIIDIVEDRVALSDVDWIFGTTVITDDEDFEDVIGVLRKFYWKEFPDKAERIFRKLWSDGTILQPRLEAPPRFAIFELGKHWVQSELEITWKNVPMWAPERQEPLTT